MLAVSTAILTSAQLPFAPALLDFFDDVVGSVCLDGDPQQRRSPSNHAQILGLLPVLIH